MKAYYKLLFFVGLLTICLSFIPDSQGTVKGFGKDVKVHQKMSKSETNVVVEKVYDLNGLVKTEIHLDTTKFGVCDTCSGSFLTALKVNRQLVDSLNKENGTLYQKYIDCVNLNKELDSINGLVSKEIEKSKRLLRK